ncbi:MAG: GPP34 family phosphoprotein [Candidatus Cloacimonetes bacterium]|nr:GPP34 family phosphoprotein [Candidatus Cloacimonadota bacterium]
MNDARLTLAEEFLLLALDDEKGVVCNQPFMGLEFGLAGAVLMELSLMGKIKATPEMVEMIDENPCADEIFDDALAMIKEQREAESARYWVWKLGIHIQEIKDYFLKRLVEKGILEKKEKNILWILHRKCYPLVNEQVEDDVKERIRAAVFSREAPSERDVVLISLIKSCNLTELVFGNSEQKNYQERIDSITAMDVIGQAVYQAIYEILQKLSMQQLYY